MPCRILPQISRYDPAAQLLFLENRVVDRGQSRNDGADRMPVGDGVYVEQQGRAEIRRDEMRLNWLANG